MSASREVSSRKTRRPPRLCLIAVGLKRPSLPLASFRAGGFVNHECRNLTLNLVRGQARPFGWLEQLGSDAGSILDCVSAPLLPARVIRLCTVGKLACAPPCPTYQWLITPRMTHPGKCIVRSTSSYRSDMRCQVVTTQTSNPDPPTKVALSLPTPLRLLRPIEPRTLTAVFSSLVSQSDVPPLPPCIRSEGSTQLSCVTM